MVHSGYQKMSIGVEQLIFNRINRAINYFNRVLITVLTHISFMLFYTCRCNK